MRVHGKLPQKPHGELVFAQACTKFLPEDSDVWFNVHLPNVGEIDALLLIPGIGIFCTEIKGHLLSHIAQYRNSEILEASRDGESGKILSPITQATRAKNGAKDFFQTKSSTSVPWLMTCIGFPHIEKAEWIERFDDDEASHRFLFGEHIESEKNFIDYFENLCSNPIVGYSQRSVPGIKKLDLVRTILMKTLRRDLKLYVQERLIDSVESEAERELVVFGSRGYSKEYRAKTITSKEIERLDYPASKIKSRLRDLKVLEADQQKQAKMIVEVNGVPGSGKTALLTQWAKSHLENGDSVLYLTYNKTLAAEIRRFLFGIAPVNEDAMIDSFPELHVFDAFEFRRSIEALQTFPVSKPPPSSNYEQSFEERTKSLFFEVRAGEEYPRNPIFPKFKYIAIDEAQDMPESIMVLIKESSDNDAVWLIATDKNQRIYRSDELEFSMLGSQHHEIEMRATIKAEGNRVSPEVMEAQRILHEHYLNSDEAISSLIKWKDKIKNANEERLFPIGDVGHIKLLQWPSKIGAQKSILAEIMSSVNFADPRGLMILSKRPDHPRNGEFKKLLHDMKIEINDSLDTESENRRKSIGPGQVHLLTIHSARGLESDNVLVIGLSGLSDEEFDPALVHIALTRARNTTIVLIDPANSQREKERNALDFLIKICEASTGFVEYY